MAARNKKLERMVAFAASDFGLAGLEALREAGRLPELVVTRRDLDPETEKRTRPSATVRWAKKHDQAVVIPEDTAKEKWLQPLLDEPPDLILTIGWESPLPSALLEAPALGCIGIHASNLPKYRGANPVRAALSEGESSTGVTVYRIEGDDWSGPILLSESVDIGAQEVYGELAPRIAALGAELTIKTVERLAAGKKFTEKKQDDRRSSQAGSVDRRHRKAPWWLTAKEVYNRLRAYSPEPGLETFIKAGRVEIVKGKPMEWLRPTYGDTGTYLGLRSGRLAVLCDQSTVFGVERLRRIGGETVGASRYAREEDLSVGSSFV